jgi:uncharacterized protein with FMN-binding domain
MRRALIATAGTVVGLVILLGYRSEGAVKGEKVDVGSTSSTGTSTGTTVPGATTVPSAKNASQDHNYTGQDVFYRYGDIEVAVALDGSRIVSVSVPENNASSPYSQTVNSAAVPVLMREAVAAQGLDFDVVSGATYTSDAFAQSLQSALDKVSE